MSRFVPVLGAAAAILALMTFSPGSADAGSEARLRSEDPIDPVYGQGVARGPDGWVVSGRNVLGTLDDGLRETLRVSPVIPADLAAQGFDHVGDPDVAGAYLYVPLEQPDYGRGQQITARYDPVTLTFVDAVVLPQHHNSFVAVDDEGVAYSTDFFDDSALLRYDVERDWEPLDPLRLSHRLERVQGGDVARGAVWLSTDDDRNGIYRVDLDTGRVEALGSTGHLDGEGEGIDARTLSGGSLHTLTVDAEISPVWFGHFDVRRGPRPRSTDDDVDSTWPPVLVFAGVVLLVGAVVAIAVVFRHARGASREPPGPSE
jgi:hypothetical protein